MIASHRDLVVPLLVPDSTARSLTLATVGASTDQPESIVLPMQSGMPVKIYTDLTYFVSSFGGTHQSVERNTLAEAYSNSSATTR